MLLKAFGNNLTLKLAMSTPYQHYELKTKNSNVQMLCLYCTKNVTIWKHPGV